MTRTATFAREQLRAPFTLALIVVVPALFVVSASGALSDFASALGGSIAGDAAVALSAGWAAAFVSGALGFFAAVSSHGADRRLSIAGLAPARVAASRIGSSVLLALIASAAAFAALELRAPAAHPVHAAAGILGFALLYLGVGVLIGSIVRAPLEGSLIVAFLFLLDAFSGPGMDQSAPLWSFSQKAADVVIAAGSGMSSTAGDWLGLVAVVLTAIAAAIAAFALAARSRS